MATFKKTISVAYAVAGGSSSFAIPHDLKKYKTVDVQINYTALDVGDGTLSVSRSNDNSRFTAVVGSATMVTGVSKSSDINIADHGADRLQLDFTAGTDTAGTIQDIIILAKTE